MWCDLDCGGVALVPGREQGQRAYLPSPQEFVANRRGQAGFTVDHELCQQAGSHSQHVCHGKVFRSYGEWWQAHQKPPPKEIAVVRHAAVSSTYWPYGNGVTTLTGAVDGGNRYFLDDRPVVNVIPNGAHQLRSSTSLTARRLGDAHIRTAGSIVSSGSASLSSSRSMPSLQRVQRANSFAAVDVVDRLQTHSLMGSNSEAVRFATQQIC